MTSSDSTYNREFLEFQRKELTEYNVYTKLALSARNTHNCEMLTRLADMEHTHAKFWEGYTKVAVKPHRIAVFAYPFLARLLGLTFAINLFERSTANKEKRYHELVNKFPDMRSMLEDEEEHEREIIEMLHDPFRINTSSIVLGLNDALVEITGTMAGLTFALHKTIVIAVVGFITGLAAALSMTAAEYLSTKSEEGDRNPFVAAIFTGGTYLTVVLLFITPYILIDRALIAFGVLAIEAILIIAFFAFYHSVVRGISFRRQFLEMTLISASVALITFLVAVGIRTWLGVQL